MPVGYEFNPKRSHLGLDPGLVAALVKELEIRLGHGAKIIGILEIGSFTKGEAVPSSDSDLRIYIESPGFYFWQSFGADQKAKLRPEKEERYSLFLSSAPPMPCKTFVWDDFNNPVSHELSEMFGVNFEFGVADMRFVRQQFSELKDKACGEYELFFQGSILYDPEGELSFLYRQHFGVRYDSLAEYYQKLYLDQLQPQVVMHTEPNKYDKHKLEKSGQILWIKWAVRAIRDAIASKAYQKTGNFVYKKNEILDFCKKYIPQHFDLIGRLYCWKTNPSLRSEMIKQFIDDPAPFFEQFKAMTPQIEQIVSDINHLEL